MNNSPKKLIGALARNRLVIFVVLLVASGSFLGYTLLNHKPSASSLTTAIPTPTAKLPAEFEKVQKLNAQIDDAINSGSENTVCSLLATRSPLLQAAISRSPDNAGRLLFDSSTLASIDPMPCAADTVEQPNTTVAGNVQVGIVDLLDNASTAPEETYALTSSDNKLYSVSFSDYNKPTANLPQTGQTMTAKGTLIDQTLLAASQGVTITNRTTRAVAKSQLGIHKLLVLFFTFPDSPAPSPYSLTDPTFQAKVKTDFQANQDYWNQATWGQIKFQGQNAADPADYKFVSVGEAPKSSCASIAPFDWLQSLPAAVGIANYDNVVAFAPISPDCASMTYLGLTSGISGKFSVIEGTQYASGYTRPVVISHELGHQLGLYHGASYIYPCLDNPHNYGRLNCTPSSREYDDQFNRMGNLYIHYGYLPSSLDYPTTDLPGIDKQVLGVLPPTSGGSASLTGLNTAGNPLIVKLYSLEANPNALPPNAYQHFEVSSSLFGPATTTPKIDIEFRPNLPSARGTGRNIVLFHIDDRGNPADGDSPTVAPNKTHTLDDGGGSNEELSLRHGVKTLNNMNFEFTDITGSVATVKITETPTPCDVTPTISNYQTALLVGSKNPAPVITNSYKITSNAPTTCATQRLNLSASIDTSMLPPNLTLSNISLVSGTVAGSPIAVSLPAGSSLTVTATVRLTNNSRPFVPLRLFPSFLPSLILTVCSCGG